MSERAENGRRLGGRALPWTIGALLALGFVARVVPLVSAGGRLLRQFPAEDAYLMLTIARNVAIGNGMSTAAGTIPTNGTQPGITFVWALGSWLQGGDKVGTVAFAMAGELLISCCAALALFVLGRRLLGERAGAARAAAFGAAAWFATDAVVRQSMNGLETGANALCAVLFACALLGRSGDPSRAWSTGRSLRLGLLLGVAFWVRNDAVFLIAAACVTRALLVAPRPGEERGHFGFSVQGFGQACIAGATSVAVASPWMIHNRVRFGSIMPISGSSQSWAYGFGDNLHAVPPVLFEYAALVLPIPSRFQSETAVVVACAAVVAAALALVVRFALRGGMRERAYLVFAGLYVAGLVGYYGLFFGAPWFLSRYLFPLAALVAPLWGLAALAIWRRVVADGATSLGAATGALLLAVVAYPNLRTYRAGTSHLHFQVVEWVAEHVEADEWIAAVQTGTIGYFHDRTINLDGKVNPEALAAMLDGKLGDYLVESPARYFADWAQATADWYSDPNHPEVRAHFELVVLDHERNLGVLARRGEGSSVPAGGER